MAINAKSMLTSARVDESKGRVKSSYGADDQTEGEGERVHRMNADWAAATNNRPASRWKLQIASTMRTLAKPHCNNATRFTVTIICLLISPVESAVTRTNVPSKIAGPFRSVISARRAPGHLQSRATNEIKNSEEWPVVGLLPIAEKGILGRAVVTGRKYTCRSLNDRVSKDWKL
ncbi:hypothetical protein K0M31_019433 [Melipona bicolor]|uniref:Uncharacterized protein n=1 Tax=Melipona bicolor TaxID=60889 RepID=A0AA40KR67_9HYME|nr:hypothetical protein K0M31_019433 [Melipona bicolor]